MRPFEIRWSLPALISYSWAGYMKRLGPLTIGGDYDAGPVVRQSKVPVLPGHSIELLKMRVQACEREFVVDTLAGIAKGEITLANIGWSRRGLVWCDDVTVPRS
jgi:hypothetical protein